MITRKDIVQLVANTLDVFISDFRVSPYDFFYEEDARSILYSSLVSEWKKLKMNRLSELKWIVNNKTIVKDAETIPFKAEYPQPISAQNVRPSRFDIAYIENKKDHDNFYVLPASIAIELKLGSKINDKSGGFHDDLKALINCQQEQCDFTGIALYLYQPTELAGQQDSVSSEIHWLKSKGFTIREEEGKKIFQIPEQGVKGYFATIDHLHSLIYNPT